MYVEYAVPAVVGGQRFLFLELSQWTFLFPAQRGGGAGDGGRGH